MAEKGGREKPIRAIFFDVDGTLVSFETHRVLKSARDALAEAKRRGILLFVATGRHPLALRYGGWLEGMDFSGFVTMNGSYCFSGDEVVYQNAIDPGDLEALRVHLEREPVPCMFCEADRMYLNYADSLVRSVHEAIGTPLPEVLGTGRILSHPIYQVCVFTQGGEGEGLVACMPHCGATQWHHSGLDILPQGGDKWLGIERMLDRFGLGADEIVTFGDGENDIEMLARAGRSVAMGNAPESVKRAAKFVTKDIGDGGLAHAFAHYLSMGQADW